MKTLYSILFAMFFSYAYGLTQGEIDGNRAEEIGNKKNNNVTLSAEDEKWYSDYKKKIVRMWENDKTVAPQLVLIASNIASKVLYDYKDRSGVKKVEAHIQVDGPATDKYRIKLSYKTPSIFTANLTKKGALKNSINIMKELVATPELKEVEAFEINSLASGTDKYGREEDFSFVSITLYRPTIEKIEVKKMSWDMIEALAQSEGKLWYHPSIRSKK